MSKHGCKTEEPETADIVVAEPPFDKDDDDLILRSSNDVHFYVNKTILALVSPALKDMVSSDQLIVDHHPCVPVQDDSVELYQLLSWCDPRGLPTITLDAMQMALRLADKYVADAVTRRIKNVLEAMDDLVKAECVRVYALAVQYRFAHLAQKAARYSLTIPLHLFPIVPEFDNLKGGAIQRLYAFHLACSQAAAGYIRTGEWITAEYAHSFSHVEYERRSLQFGARYLELDKWFATYISEMQSLLLERPVADVVLDPSSYADALLAITSCVGCRLQVQTFLSLVSHIAEGIDKVVKAVEVLPLFRAKWAKTNTTR